MRRTRRAKILSTLGPASSSKDMILKLCRAGTDVFRLNFSHGSAEEHRARLAAIREVEREVERPIGVLLDLQGPKLRVGRMADGTVNLEAGSSFRLDLDEAPGNGRRAPLPHPEVFAALREGTRLLLDDGKLCLEVQACGPDFAETLVRTGGPLSDRKGVNVPDAVLPISPLTKKDLADLEYGLELGVDWVALSFVQRPKDLEDAIPLIAGRARIMSKIEKPAALGCLDELVRLSDGIMVARGDLGVEMPPEEVPGRQKQMIRACRLAGKPVVVATQMLDSMVHTPAPTRAEASDVATAVYDGADAVMLSAETAVGAYPVESVTMMERIIRSTEQDDSYRPILHALHPMPDPTPADAISAAAAQVADTISAAAIACYTMSGSTALRAARERPTSPLLVLTNREATARGLAVLWGAHCVVTEDVESAREMVAKACGIAVGEGIANLGDALVITAGVPFGTPGTTNLLRIAQVES